jgi:putative copper export protein
MLSLTRSLALGIWVGAMAAFAFIFAPTVFRHVGPTPQFAATIAACVRQISATGAVLGMLVIVATVAMRESARKKALVIGAIVLALVLSAIETWSIVPAMEQTPLLTPAYESLHRASSGVYAAVLILALGAFVISSRSTYR